MARGLYLGLISGTSADGIDAALIDCDPSGEGRIELVAGRMFPYPADLRELALALGQPDTRIDLDALGEVDARIGEQFAESALGLLAEAGIAPDRVRAIGSHGQTIRHRPEGSHPFSMQIGDAARIAERTQIATVADFRRRDIAAGGQGAPLAPAFHQAVFAADGESRAVLNLGGIANLTLLPRHGPVLGFDTGPANGLMDAWIVLTRGASFDRDGALAVQGKVDQDLMRALLADPWFALTGPKSTGREQFNLEWLRPRLAALGNVPGDADVQATLCALSAETIAASLLREMPDCARLLVCGGGVHNPVLMRMLSDRLDGVSVESTATLGLDPDLIEAMTFAWLAARTMAGLTGNLPSVTGAARECVLGAFHPRWPVL